MGERRSGRGFSHIDGRRGERQKHAHGDDQRPRLFARARHTAKGDDAPERQSVHRRHGDQIGQRRRVFKRVGGIGVEEAAAIRADLFDGFLAGYGSKRQGLFGAFKRRDVEMLGQGLGHALQDERQGHDQRERQEDVERHPHHVAPEIAQSLAPVRRESPRQSADQGDARCAGKEVLNRQSRHLGEVRHGRLTRIGLPVGVGDEADRGIKGEVRRQAGQFQRIEGQKALSEEHQVQKGEAGRIEGQQRQSICQPVLFLQGLLAHCGIDEPLDRADHRVKQRLFARKDFAKKNTHRPGGRQGKHDRQGDFRPTLPGHGENSV